MDLLEAIKLARKPFRSSLPWANDGSKNKGESGSNKRRTFIDQQFLLFAAEAAKVCSIDGADVFVVHQAACLSFEVISFFFFCSNFLQDEKVSINHPNINKIFKHINDIKKVLFLSLCTFSLCFQRISS